MSIHKYILVYAVLWIFITTSCQHDTLSDDSVIDRNTTQTQTAQWIEENFTKVYGPEVIYQWQKDNSQNGVYVYPPDTTNIKQVLNAIGTLCFDTFKDIQIEGKGSLLNYCLPIRITLYGGGNPDKNSVERMYNIASQPVEMSIYHVNDFDAKDEQKVYRLIRSVYHQMMKRMLEQIPYDRETFATISDGKYINDTQLLSDIKGANNDIGLTSYANKRGFFTYLSMLNPEDDMAEMFRGCISLKEVDLRNFNTSKVTDMEKLFEGCYSLTKILLNNTYKKEAERAYHDFIAKKAFVEKYTWDNWHVKLLTIQLKSIRTLDKYLNKK